MNEPILPEQETVLSESKAAPSSYDGEIFFSVWNDNFSAYLKDGVIVEMKKNGQILEARVIN